MKINPVYEKNENQPCLGREQQFDSLKQVDTVLLCGVEAHVCVHATARDFISRAFQVFFTTISCLFEANPLEEENLCLTMNERGKLW